MKMFLDEFTVLDMNDLIAVNGGYGSSSYSSTSSSSKTSSSSSYSSSSYSNSGYGTTTSSSVPSGYSASSVLITGYGPNVGKGDDAGEGAADSGKPIVPNSGNEKSIDTTDLVSGSGESTESVSYKITKAAESLDGTLYVYDNIKTTVNEEFRCDNFVEKVLTDAGYISTDYLSGKATEKNVSDHIANALESKLTTKTAKTENPNLPAGSYVMYMNDSPAKNNYDPHAALVVVQEDGSVIFWDNNGNNPSKGVDSDKYSNINAVQSAYGYDSFYYLEIK